MKILLSLMKLRIKYFAIICSVSIISIYIWQRFLVEHLPKEVPFILNLLKLILLINLCVIPCYVIIRSFYPSKANVLLLSLRGILLAPFELLDNNIKNNKSIKPIFEKYFLTLLEYIEKHYSMLVYFEYGIQIILTCILLFEIFCMQKIILFYKYLWLFLGIYLIKYYLYTITVVKTNQIKLIQAKCDINLYHIGGAVIPLEIFISLQVNDVMQGHPLTSYGIDFKMDYFLEEARKLNKHKVQRINTKKLLDNTEGVVNLIRTIAIVEQNYFAKYMEFKSIRIILFLVKFICWSYVLLKSINTLPVDTFLPLMSKYENPFLFN